MENIPAAINVTFSPDQNLFKKKNTIKDLKTKNEILPEDKTFKIQAQHFVLFIRVIFQTHTSDNSLS